MEKGNIEMIWVVLRVVMGSIMLWAFFDKTFGLGFSTASDASWLSGTSPTSGFLQFGTHGFFKPIFESFSGNVVIDWLFMMGLLGVGVSLILGIGIQIAGYSGALMMFLLWLSMFPPENNPIFDEHVVYMIIFLGFTKRNIGDKYCLARWWKKTTLVKKHDILR